MKPKLVCVDQTFLNGPSDHHLPLFAKHFEVSDYNERITYEKGTTFLYQTDSARTKVKRYEDHCKFIADGIWEVEFFCSTNFSENTLGLIAAGHQNNSRVVSVPKWFWFEEHFSQQGNRQVHRNLPFNHDKTKTFLMQIGDAKSPRIKLYEELKQRGLLDNALYSFLAYGTGLEGNFDKTEYDASYPPFNQRAYRPEWYNDTHFTMVPEAVDEVVDGPDDCFITEKTMKPIMYGHPFIVLGDTGTYDLLESWGFHTFPELFDQSFDREQDLDNKIKMICEQIEKFKSKDVTTKVVHNFDRFWDRQLVEDLMLEDLIEPMLGFISKN